MIRGGLIFSFIVYSINLFGQNSSFDSLLSNPDSIVSKNINATPNSSISETRSNDFDRIVRYNNDILVVSIKTEISKSVQFIYPLNDVVNYLPYSQIREIRYRNGTIKNFEVSVKKVAKDSTGNENSWKNVIVVYEKNDVEGMKELGQVDSHLEADKINTSNELLEKNATFFIRKKAAKLGAKKVLIISTKFDSAYGDAPVVLIKGIAYGNE